PRRRRRCRRTRTARTCPRERDQARRRRVADVVRDLLVRRRGRRTLAGRRRGPARRDRLRRRIVRDPRRARASAGLRMRFVRSVWEFVVGDDWLLALAAVGAVGATYALAHDAVNAWWLLPAVVLVTLYVSVRRGA